jgi:hypothetical protein
MKQPEMDWPIQVQSAQREVCRLLFAIFPPRLAVPGANLVLNKSVIPFTPRFSAVESDPQPTKPFQRFIAAIPIKPESR